MAKGVAARCDGPPADLVGNVTACLATVVNSAVNCSFANSLPPSRRVSKSGNKGFCMPVIQPPAPHQRPATSVVALAPAPGADAAACATAAAAAAFRLVGAVVTMVVLAASPTICARPTRGGAAGLRAAFLPSQHGRAGTGRSCVPRHRPLGALEGCPVPCRRRHPLSPATAQPPSRCPHLGAGDGHAGRGGDDGDRVCHHHRRRVGGWHRLLALLRNVGIHHDPRGLAVGAA